MKYSTATILSTAFWSLTLAASLEEREVPQEHSHEPILVKVGEMLKLDNPKKIQDPVFGLLGDGAAKQGAGEVTNLSCLQRSISDQAFTNAKKANDIDGMTNAVLYAALERNTGAVGKESDICNEPAVNPEIEAIERHQDPASKNAAETNKAIVLEAAKQIDSFGGDPQLAAKSATFAPGKIGDPTAAGNTCDDQNDKDGCIFTKKLIQVEATPEEIKAAVASVSKNKKRHNGIDHLKREQSDSVPRNSFLNKRHAPKNSGKLISKRGLSSHLQSESQNLHKRDNDDRKNRQNRNNRNRGNRNKDNDDKKKRDIDGNDNDSDNGNGNDNDNDFDKRDDDDRKNRQNRNNRNRGNRNKDNDDKKKRDIDGNDNDSDNGNGNDNDNDFDKRDENIQTFEGKLGGLPPKVTENPNSDRPFTVNGDTFVGKSVALQRSCSIQHNACANAANSGSGSVSDCEKQEQECNEVAKSASKRSISSIVPRNIQRINRRRNATQLLKKRANNFGSCSKPEIQFKSGFDGRKEESFKATNQEDFNHGSTQNIKITSDFICERLKSTCEAPEETVNKCQAASTAAASLSGQEAADAFNNGVGA